MKTIREVLERDIERFNKNKVVDIPYNIRQWHINRHILKLLERIETLEARVRDASSSNRE